MDTPIITAIITASGGVVAAFVNTLLKKKDKPEGKKPEPASPTQSIFPATSPKDSTDGAGLNPAVALPQSPSSASAVPRKEFPLTHSQIDKSISDAALYHRDGVAEGYVGMRVCWLGKLTHVRRVHHDVMQISFMLVEDDSSLFCHVQRDKITVLIPLREGAVVEVCGQIKNVSHQTTVLVDCEFSVVREKECS